MREDRSALGNKEFPRAIQRTHQNPRQSHSPRYLSRRPCRRRRPCRHLRRLRPRPLRPCRPRFRLRRRLHRLLHRCRCPCWQSRHASDQALHARPLHPFRTGRIDEVTRHSAGKERAQESNERREQQAQGACKRRGTCTCTCTTCTCSMCMQQGAASAGTMQAQAAILLGSALEQRAPWSSAPMEQSALEQCSNGAEREASAGFGSHALGYMLPPLVL